MVQITKVGCYLSTTNHRECVQDSVWMTGERDLRTVDYFVANSVIDAVYLAVDTFHSVANVLSFVIDTVRGLQTFRSGHAKFFLSRESACQCNLNIRLPTSFFRNVPENSQSREITHQ